MSSERPSLEPAPVDGPWCRNCGARADVRYCPVCGQETRIEMPTVGHFVAEFAEQTLALQGQLWRTLYCLLFQPGLLTLEYVAGRRQRYVRPLRLYLALSILFFAALGLSGNVGFVELDPADQAELDAARDEARAAVPAPVPAGDAPVAAPDALQPNDALPRLEDRRITVKTGHAEFDARVQARIDELLLLPGDKVADLIFETFTAWAPVAMFFLMPLFAAFLKLGYARRGAHYAVHLLFAVNFHSFVFLVLLIGLLPVIDAVGDLLLIAIPVYLWLALRRVHGGGILSTALFVLLLFVVYVVAMALVMALSTVIPLALL